MRFSILLFAFLLFNQLQAATGDTTWVQANHVSIANYNDFDTAVIFPSGSVKYRKIYMIFTLGEYNCPAGTLYCHQWDYDVENYIMTPTDTFELARFITPYATSGVPGFPATWKQHYIFDVTDFANILKNNALNRVHYAGYTGGFTLDVKYAFIEGTPERDVLSISKLWKGTFTFGNPANLIDSNVKAKQLTPPANTAEAALKLIISGHGNDSLTGCCEFDNTGTGQAYSLVQDNTILLQKNMNINCGQSQIYPQGGTWAYGRAGNWCPGEAITIANHPLQNVHANTPFSVDLDFDDSYDGLKRYGIYKMEGAVVFYGAKNKNVDASIEDIIAPTNFEWYKRQNPVASRPIIKVRNTGKANLTKILIRYGVKDSATTDYIWMGNLPSLTDTILTLPALKELTNLSLSNATGLHDFEARIIQANGQTDDDNSNDFLYSKFAVAPKWPAQIVVNLTTSSLDASGGFNGNPSDASWKIMDETGAVVASRVNGNTKTTYKDTVTLLSSSFYKLSVSTSNCVGLQWWAMYADTHYVAGNFGVKDVATNSSLSFNGNTTTGQYRHDFGCGFDQYFTTFGSCAGGTTPVIARVGNSLITASGLGSYQWQLNGVNIAGATNSTFNITKGNGNYTVLVTDGTGCVNSSVNFTVLDLGIELNTSFEDVKLYPNPATNKVDLQVGGNLVGTTYQVFDLSGRLLFSNPVNQEYNTFDIAHLTQGVYLVQVGKVQKKVYKLIKE